MASPRPVKKEEMETDQALSEKEKETEKRDRGGRMHTHDHTCTFKVLTHGFH